MYLKALRRFVELDAATLQCSQSYALTVLGSRCHADQDRTNESL